MTVAERREEMRKAADAGVARGSGSSRTTTSSSSSSFFGGGSPGAAAADTVTAGIEVGRCGLTLSKPH